MIFSLKLVPLQFQSMDKVLYFVLEFALPKMLNVMDLEGQLPLPTIILIASGEILPAKKVSTTL